jgi:methionyl-tRNA synthetase
MTERPRYYLTTAIAYANAKPGVHTLYEVIGADVIARWHRMKGDDTRFLTGTDEHSINIAQAAVDEARPAREFVDEKVGYFREAEDALAISPDRFIRTTDPDHVRAAQEMVRRAHANGDIYLGTYEGWYCPNEGFRNATDVVETASGTICPNHPDVPLQWLTERNWFFRLSAYAADSRTSRSPASGRPAAGASRSRSARTVGRPSGRMGRGTPRRASSTSGTTRSSTTSPVRVSRTISSRSGGGGPPTCT